MVLCDLAQNDVISYDVVPARSTYQLGDRAGADGAYPDKKDTSSDEDVGRQGVPSYGDAVIFNLCKSGES